MSPGSGAAPATWLVLVVRAEPTPRRDGSGGSTGPMSCIFCLALVDRRPRAGCPDPPPGQAAPAEPLGNAPLLLYPGRAEPPFPGAFGVPDYPFEPALTQQRKERERRRVKRVSEGYARPRGHLPGARVVRGPLAALRVGGIQPLIGPVAARGVRGAVPLQGAAGGPQGQPRRGAALPAGATLPPSPSATAGRGPSSLGRVDGRGFEGPAGIGSPVRAARAPRPLRAAGGQPGTVIPGPAPAMRRLSTRWPQTPASSWGAWGPPPQPHPARSPEGELGGRAAAGAQSRRDHRLGKRPSVFPGGALGFRGDGSYPPWPPPRSGAFPLLPQG